MLRKRFDHGYSEQAWESAKDEARKVMIARACRRQTVTYSELVAGIRSIRLLPHAPPLFHLLVEVSTAEFEAGRGLLTVVVVHKSGDMAPGTGFFELATSLGQVIDNKEAFWIGELNRVFDQWSSRHPSPTGKR